MDTRTAAVRKHWFGLDSAEPMAPVVLLMERDRVSQYQAAFDWTSASFDGVFRGVTGTIDGQRLSVVHSLGPAHVADCVEFLTATCEVRRLFATGSVGGLSAEVGDIVEISAATTMDGYTLAHEAGTAREEPGIGRVVDVDGGATTGSGGGTHPGGATGDRMFTVPSVSWETDERMLRLRELGYLGVDLETGPFLAACRRSGVPGSCVHWVTDTPLERSFYFAHEGDPEAVRKQRADQHLRWLNQPRLILPRVLAALRSP